jgi:phage shock protein A
MWKRPRDMLSSPGNGKVVSLEDKVDLLIKAVEKLVDTVEELKEQQAALEERIQNLGIDDDELDLFGGGMN